MKNCKNRRMIPIKETLASLGDLWYNTFSAPVAQWIRASVFGTEGRGFESLPVYQEDIPTMVGIFSL